MESESVSGDFGQLSNKAIVALKRRHALHCKYEKAVELYADTDWTLAAIAEDCHVSLGGLGNYLRRYWLSLIHISEPTRPY